MAEQSKYKEDEIKDEYYSSNQKKCKAPKKQKDKSNQLPKKVKQQSREMVMLPQMAENPSPVLSNNDISKYLKYIQYAKITAQVIDKLADGAIVIIESLSKTNNEDSIQEAENQSSSDSKIDVCNILQATEKFVNKLSK